MEKVRHYLFTRIRHWLIVHFIEAPHSPSTGPQADRSLATHLAGSTPAQIQRQRWTGLNSPEGWQLPRARSVKRRDQLSSGRAPRPERTLRVRTGLGPGGNQGAHEPKADASSGPEAESITEAPGLPGALGCNPQHQRRLPRLGAPPLTKCTLAKGVERSGPDGKWVSSRSFVQALQRLGGLSQSAWIENFELHRQQIFAIHFEAGWA